MKPIEDFWFKMGVCKELIDQLKDISNINVYNDEAIAREKRIIYRLSLLFLEITEEVYNTKYEGN